jgi:hypothetical protein
VLHDWNCTERQFGNNVAKANCTESLDSSQAGRLHSTSRVRALSHALSFTSPILRALRAIHASSTLHGHSTFPASFDIATFAFFARRSCYSHICGSSSPPFTQSSAGNRSNIAIHWVKITKHSTQHLPIAAISFCEDKSTDERQADTLLFKSRATQGISSQGKSFIQKAHKFRRDQYAIIHHDA